MSTVEFPLYFFAGLNDELQTKELKLAEGSVNFYPSPDGYLENYPGKVSIFKAGVNTGDPDGNDEVRVDPPSNSMNYTKVTSFIDYLGVEHLVFAADDKVYTVEGNGARHITTLSGLGRGGAGNIERHPFFFVHEKKLIILNEGDYPRVWDGVNPVVPVGVREVPDPPYGTLTQSVWQTADFVWNPWLFDSASGDAPRWYIADQFNSGPANQQDAADAGIAGIYSWRVQFVDIYGNKGKASAPSARLPVVSKDDWDEQWEQQFALVQWTPPLVDAHIGAVQVARTSNLNFGDSEGFGVTSAMYVEHAQENTTQSRHTSWLGDSSLTSLSLMDLEVGPPPNSHMGCSFGGRIFLLSLTENRVYYSDIGYFGQFRSLQSINPYSSLSALVPAGDRLFVIGDKSTEVYYQTTGSDGAPYIALLEQDIQNGSRFGGSFVQVGDGVVFGLWDRGFGYFDGVEHKFVDEPYYIKGIYLDNVNFIHSAILVGDWYYLTIRKDYESAGNNVVLMYNVRSNSWYILEDTLNDIAYWNDEIVGVDDGLYVLFRGADFPQARAKTIGLTPESHVSQRTLSGLRVLMEPSSFTDINVTVRGEETFNSTSGEGKAHPLKNRLGRQSNQLPMQHWGHSGYKFVDKPEWLAPADFWMVPTIDKPITGFSHSVDLTFEAGHPVRIKALGLLFARTPSVAEDK